jgi:CubicO group peptidase (beta-lactamase class C family)
MRWLEGFFKHPVLLIVLSSFMLPLHAEDRHFPAGTRDVYIAGQAGVRTDVLSHIAPLIEASISHGEYPGAVVLAGHRGRIIYRGVFGNRRVEPTIAPMRLNTVFDLASLTKVMVTTPAIMQLVEDGELELDAPVAMYWPAFGQNGKSSITVRELLTHSSGLPPDLPDPGADIIGKAETLRQIEHVRPSHAPGTQFTYSDINFITLGHLVEIISEESLQHYADKHIFNLLGLKDTRYLPSASARDRIAPTQIIRGELRWGQVNDPTTYAMDGVSGAAGVFSNASDVGAYAQCLLNGGRVSSKAANKKSRYLLGPLSVLKMTSVQTPLHFSEIRGLGWDIDSPYSNRGVLFPAHSFGHTGWTGTSLWIDPVTQTWVVILTSRTHPRPAHYNQLVNDRRAIANIVSGSIRDITVFNQNNTGAGEIFRAYR